jgi:asparagine synthase (glutamine-hydrolysing)
MCGIVFAYGDIYIPETRIGVQRGPDGYQKLVIGRRQFHHYRLAINNTKVDGSQPFIRDNVVLIVNGEINNWEAITSDRDKLRSDSEVILELYLQRRNIRDVLDRIQGMYAAVLYDFNTGMTYIFRDPTGIKPLYIQSTAKMIVAASMLDMFPLESRSHQVSFVKPGHLYTISPDSTNYSIVPFDVFSYTPNVIPIYKETPDGLQLISKYHTRSEAISTIESILRQEVKSYLQCDRPIGFLASGGLDSSLIIALAAEYLDELTLITVSTSEDTQDAICAKQLAQHLIAKGKKITHYISTVSEQDIVSMIPRITGILETPDTTTNRAGLMHFIASGVVCSITQIKRVLGGDGADEIFGGYKYMQFAPNDHEFMYETVKLINGIHMYDNRRGDATTSACGLEYCVPFQSSRLIHFILKHVDPKDLMPRNNGIEKSMLREIAAKYMPHEVAYRPKEAFSNSVSSGSLNLIDVMQKYTKATMTLQDVCVAESLPGPVPKSPEAAYYKLRYVDMLQWPLSLNLYTEYWLPNKNWPYCNVDEPSATILPSSI